MTWGIEGDIKGYFDNIDHKRFIEILSKYIKDQSFIDLVRKFLKAGYFEHYKEGVFHSITGVPQGETISPLLSNIYLNSRCI